jgi:hypothetical protein
MHDVAEKEVLRNLPLGETPRFRFSSRPMGLFASRAPEFPWEMPYTSFLRLSMMTADGSSPKA